MHKEQPVVTHAKAKFVSVLQAPDISFAGLDEAVQGVQDTQGGWLVKSPDISLGVFGPGDAVQAGSR